MHDDDEARLIATEMEIISAQQYEDGCSFPA